MAKKTKRNGAATPTVIAVRDPEVADRVMDAIEPLLVHLWGRWRDEREFEDWRDYQDAIKREVEKVEGVQRFEAMPRKGVFRFFWVGADGFRRKTGLNRTKLETVGYGRPADEWEWNQVSV